MRCYRCGALMDAGMEICPECGFHLHSPVEIQMSPYMSNIEIFDHDGILLWKGAGTETAFIDAPEEKQIRIKWSSDLSEDRQVINGEAYRFENTKLAKGFAKMVKTRSISKH